MSEADGDTEGDVIEILPLEDYDSYKAKLRASLSWILHKAYPDGVPAEFKEPFYETPDNFLHVKPRLANMMVTSELYCQACVNMFGDSHTQWQGHWSIIQVLCRKGIYVSEANETAVTETVLMKNTPLNMNAHLALIDALMMAYVREVVTIERVVQAVRHFATFNASSELPCSAEDAILFWINKVCCTLQHRMKAEPSEQILQGQSNQKVRIVSRSDQSINIPYIEDLLQDIGDGCSVAALVSFYCPTSLKPQDICLKENVGIADSLYNLRLVKTFCQEHVPIKCYHLTYEDFLYTHSNLKHNILVMLAELFYWLEVKKLDCVQDPSKTDQASRPPTAKRASTTPHPNVPAVSNVTKQSFHRSHDPHLSQSSSAPPPPRQPLLHRRQQGSMDTDTIRTGSKLSTKQTRRCHSLSTDKERDAIRESVLAWQDKNEQMNGEDQVSSSQHSNLLANVSMDSDVMDSFSDDKLGSIDLDLSDSTPPPTLPTPRVTSNIRDPKHPDYMEIQSVTSGEATSRTVGGGNAVGDKAEVIEEEKPVTHSGLLQEFQEQYKPESRSGQPDSRSGQPLQGTTEPLLPARLKPRKEITNNHSKEVERGDKDVRQRSSPPKVRRSLKDMETVSSSGVSEASSETDVVTPLPDDQLSGSEGDTPYSRRMESGPGYAAFTVQTDLSSDLQQSQPSTARSSVKLSYTVQNHGLTAESARAAGIPVVSDSGDGAMHRWGSREGSVASSRSSGDFSDHESQKIHRDHKFSESREKDKNNSSVIREERLVKILPEARVISKPTLVVKERGNVKDEKQKGSLTTNFAEIKRLRNVVGGNKEFVFMQHDQEGFGNKKSQGNSQSSVNKDNERPRTIAAATNQRRTWQQTTSNTANQNAGIMEDSGISSPDSQETTQPVVSELTQIRLKLEEKRKMIERKKLKNEVQQQKVRQKLGKTVFMNVIAKPSKEEESQNDSEVRAGVVQPATTSTGELASRVSSLASTREEEEECSAQPSSSSRAFSREGIQQTIENVRKKWFKEEEEAGDGRSDASVSQRMGTSDNSQIRFSDVPKLRQAEVTTSKPVRDEPRYEQRELREEQPVDREVKTVKASELVKNDMESQQTYNDRLDHLNQSINSLKGEIQQMSLNSAKELQRMATPERALLERPVGGVFTPDRVALTTPHYQHTPMIQAGHPMNVTLQQPVIAGLNQVSNGTPYTSYIPSTQHSHPYPTPGYPASHPAPYHPVTQSPPQGIYPPAHSQYGMSPVMPPYNVGTTPLQYPSHVPAPGVPPVPAPGLPPSSVIPHVSVVSPSSAVHYIPHSHTGAQVFHPSSGRIPPSSAVTSTPPHPGRISDQTQQPVSMHSKTLPSSRPDRTLLCDTPASSKESRQPTTNIVNNSGRNFESSPQRSVRDQPVSSTVDSPAIISSQPKPTRQHAGKLQDTTPAQPADTSWNAADHSANASGVDHNISGMNPHSISGVDPGSMNQSGNITVEDMDTSDKAENMYGVGFVIGQEEASLTQSTEDEMLRKKEKLIQQQIKRREEQERKRQYKEIEMARRREQERLKIEESEKRKAEEKARREQIFRQYQDKKHSDDEPTQPVRRRAKSRDQQRPKSMYAKQISGSEEGLHSMNSSHEDVSAQAFTISPGHEGRTSGNRLRPNLRLDAKHGKMRKAVSCNTLSNASSEGKLTFRRPPSPDLAKLKKGHHSTTSSETGSNGSDYAGPKLFVKPSAKSNRHIIINSITQCVLAGPVNAEQKNKVLEELAKSDAKHFVILFRDHSCQYRGLYSFDPDIEEAVKIHGIGPKILTNKMIERFYKYNSGGKNFSEVTSTKHLSVSIDAVVIHNALWKTSKGPAKR